MKSVVLLVVLAVAACLVEGNVAEQKPVAIAKAPLAVDLNKVEASDRLTKERLENFRKAVEAFKAKIDATRMNTTHKEAIKQEALTRLAQRLAQLKQKTPKKA